MFIHRPGQSSPPVPPSPDGTPGRAIPAANPARGRGARAAVGELAALQRPNPLRTAVPQLTRQRALTVRTRAELDAAMAPPAGGARQERSGTAQAGPSIRALRPQPPGKSAPATAPGTPPGAGAGAPVPAALPRKGLTPLQKFKKLFSPSGKSASASTARVPEKLSSWNRTGVKPGGTADGALYIDTNGQKWLVKGYGNDDMAKSEVLASHLLNAVGAHTAQMKLVDLGDAHKGGLGVASKWMDNTQPFDPRNRAHAISMQQSFVAHAWLANHDAIGLTHDNVLVQDGKAVHIDPGGALEYRAMGGMKGEVFGRKVGELETLRNPNVNPAAASVYGTMNSAAIVTSAQRVLDLPAATITKLVERHGPGDAKHRAELGKKLIERQRDIKTWCKSAQSDAANAARQRHREIKALDKEFPAQKIGHRDKRINMVAGFVERGSARAMPPLPNTAPGKHDTSVYAARSLNAMPQLSTLQQEAIYSYAHLGYDEINASLRSGKPSKTAKALDAAIRSAGGEIPPGTLLSRKIKVSGPRREQLLNAAGKVLQEPAIMSTSTEPNMFTGNLHLKLTVGPGVKGLFTGSGSAAAGQSISRMPGESELILPANTRLYIHKVTRSPESADRDGFGSNREGLDHIVHATILPTH